MISIGTMIYSMFRWIIDLESMIMITAGWSMIMITAGWSMIMITAEWSMVMINVMITAEWSMIMITAEWSMKSDHCWMINDHDHAEWSMIMITAKWSMKSDHKWLLKTLNFEIASVSFNDKWSVIIVEKLRGCFMSIDFQTLHDR